MQPLAQTLARLTGVDAEDRRPWVTDLILLERQQSDISNRETLLRAAGALAGRKNSKARDELDDRLKDLRTGSEEDQDLARIERDL
jgi:ElaB/YqjD/DUF883 family membrane-anchored ribosome-binding protein